MAEFIFARSVEYRFRTTWGVELEIEIEDVFVHYKVETEIVPDISQTNVKYRVTHITTEGIELHPQVSFKSQTERADILLRQLIALDAKRVGSKA